MVSRRCERKIIASGSSTENKTQGWPCKAALTALGGLEDCGTTNPRKHLLSRESPASPNHTFCPSAFPPVLSSPSAQLQSFSPPAGTGQLGEHCLVFGGFPNCRAPWAMCPTKMSLKTPTVRCWVGPLLAISLGWVEWLFVMLSTG